MFNTYRVILALFAVTAFGTPAGASNPFQPDLTFTFTCPGAAEAPSDATVEAFLKGKGFDVLNELHATSLSPAKSPFRQEIIAIDADEREIQFTGTPSEAKSTIVSLYSMPPTVHEAALEQSLMAFVKDDLHCTVGLTERHQNGAENRKFYQQILGEDRLMFQTQR